MCYSESEVLCSPHFTVWVFLYLHTEPNYFYMRKFLIGAMILIGASAFVTGSSHSPTHQDQNKEATQVSCPGTGSDIIQIPTLAVAPEAIQAVRYDLEWCTVVNVATAIESPVLPVQEVANSPPVTSAS